MVCSALFSFRRVLVKNLDFWLFLQFWLLFETSLLIKGQYSLVRIAFYNYFDDFHKKLSFWFHSSSNKFCFKGNTVWPLWYCLCRVFWILLILKLTFNIVYYSATSLCLTSFHGMAAWNFLEKKNLWPLFMDGV